MMSLSKGTCLISFCVTTLFPSDLMAQKFLIPQTAVVQRGGSIGYNSFGVGYNLFNNKKGSLDLSWGYVPKSKGGRQDIFAAKFAYRPFGIKIKNLGVLSPLNPGLFVTHHPGGKFHTFLEEQHPDGYYWWSSAVRIHLSGSTELKINTPKSLARTGVEHVAIFTEFNTNELYFVSWFKNTEQVPLGDIFKLGFGVKAYF